MRTGPVHFRGGTWLKQQVREKNPMKFKRVNRREERKGKGRNRSREEGYLKEEAGEHVGGHKGLIGPKKNLLTKRCFRCTYGCVFWLLLTKTNAIYSISCKLINFNVREQSMVVVGIIGWGYRLFVIMVLELVFFGKIRFSLMTKDQTKMVKQQIGFESCRTLQVYN